MATSVPRVQRSLPHRFKTAHQEHSGEWREEVQDAGRVRAVGENRGIVRYGIRLTEHIAQIAVT